MFAVAGGRRVLDSAECLRLRALWQAAGEHEHMGPAPEGLHRNTTEACFPGLHSIDGSFLQPQHS